MASASKVHPLGHGGGLSWLVSDECAGDQLCVPAFCTTNMDCGGEEEQCIEGVCEKGFCADSCKADVELSETG